MVVEFDESTFLTNVATWQQLRHDRDPNAETFYVQHVLPGVYQRFQATAYELRDQIRGLILVGSLQADTAALLIASLNPERIAMLLTRDTADFHSKVKQRLDALGVLSVLRATPETWLPLGEYNPPDDPTKPYSGLNHDHASVKHTYQGVKAILDLWSDLPRDTIAIDLTGGKSTMTVGLAKSAHVLGLKSIYIDSIYKDNQVVQGSQKLAVTPNPYLIFGDLEAAEAHHQFQQHNYAVAAQLFGKLADRVPEPHCRRYAAAEALAAAYADWEVLDFAEAHTHLNKLFTFSVEDLMEIATHRPVLEQQLAALEQLRTVAQSVVRQDADALRTLTDHKAILPLLGTLHTAAERRECQGRYDFAALFRYRCLELISQHRLAAHGLLTTGPDYRGIAIERATLMNRFKEVQQRIGRKVPKKLPKHMIVLFDGYMLLAALNDPLVNGYDIKRIEERSAARNQSVLAHGYRLIDREEYQQFAQVVDEIIDRLFMQVLDHTRVDWEKRMRFIEPFKP